MKKYASCQNGVEKALKQVTGPDEVLEEITVIVTENGGDCREVL